MTFKQEHIEGQCDVTGCGMHEDLRLCERDKEQVHFCLTHYTEWTREHGIEKAREVTS